MLEGDDGGFVLREMFCEKGCDVEKTAMMRDGCAWDASKRSLDFFEKFTSLR